jgi:hypothetical protein
MGLFIRNQQMWSVCAWVLITLLAFVTGATSGGAARDELVCFGGLVMDTYCVNLGVLHDNPTVETLRDSQIHSYHFLVDVLRCIEGGFEILVESS